MVLARPVTAGWAVTLVAVGALAVLAVLPPLLGGPVGAAVHHAFGMVCHQIPERSPHLAGGAIALCHRCSGIGIGLLAGLAAGPLLAAGLRRRVLASRQGLGLLAAAVPTAVDWTLGASGLWANTPASRMLTGAVFGVAAGIILAVNLLASRPSPAASPADA